MMDFYMAALLLIGFGLVWLLAEWCDRQIESRE